MPNFPPHPAALILPRPTPEERAALKADLEKFGMRDPIEIYDGMVIDGLTRQELGNELGLPDMTSNYRTLDSYEIGHDPVAYSLSKNLCRRHLSPSQVGMIVAQAEVERCKFAAQDTPSRGKASISAGVSARTVASAKRVIEKGAPEVIEAVKSGRVKASVAEQFVKAEPDKERQAAAMKAADPKEEVKRRISGGATFDVEEIDGAPEETGKKPKNGAPLVATNDRKEAVACIDKLSRVLQRLGVYEGYMGSLSAMRERVVKL